MCKGRAARPGSLVDSRGRPRPYEQIFNGRGHAIDRVAKLKAVTVVRGAAPSEAEFAARRARFLIAQFGLSNHGSASANIDFPPSAPLVKADAATPPGDPLAAASAYRHIPFDRRSTSALRFVELA